MAVQLVGHVQRAYWYKFRDGSINSVHVAEYADRHPIIFASDNKTWPSSHLTGENMMNYKLLRNATHEEAMAHFRDVVVETITI